MALNINGEVSKETNISNIIPTPRNLTKVALILNNVVEKIMGLGAPMPEIIFSNYQFRDVTEEKRAEKGTSMFFFEIESENGLVLTVTSDESTWAIMASHPLAVEIPDELDVQLGWTYSVETGFVSN